MIYFQKSQFLGNLKIIPFIFVKKKKSGFVLSTLGVSSDGRVTTWEKGCYILIVSE